MLGFQTQSGWTEWSKCSKTCQGGVQTRTSQCPKKKGKSCKKKTERRKCNTDPCTKGTYLLHVLILLWLGFDLFSVKQDGLWSPWTAWSSCSESCGKSSRSRTRECDSPAAANGGKPCAGPESQRKTCNNKPCDSEGENTKAGIHLLDHLWNIKL